VVVMGKVEGTIHATERTELRAGAVVVGDVFSKRFSMEQESALRGRVDPTRAAEPVAAAAAPEKSTPPAAQPSVPATPSPGPGLFGMPRPGGGQMPAGLAAAARGFGGGETPAGMSALATDEYDDPAATHKA